MAADLVVASDVPDAVDGKRSIEVMMPMRDGVKLATSIFFPEGESSLSPRVATNTIYHEADRPSAHVLTALSW